MLSWGSVPGVVIGTPAFLKWSMCETIVTGPWKTEVLNLDYMNERGPKFPGLDWKSVVHWKVDGTILSNDPSSIDQYQYGTPARPGTDVRFGGVALPRASRIGLYSEVGHGAWLLHWKSAEEYYWFAVESRLVKVKGVERVQVARCAARYVHRLIPNNKFGKWYWRRISISYDGGNWDTSGPIDVPEANWESTLPTGLFVGWPTATLSNTTTFSQTYTLTMQPIGTVQTRAQIVAYVSHLIGQVVARSEMDLAANLEFLHATSFDSLQKFDGNLVLLLSKLSSLGTATLGSYADFWKSAGSVRDVASLWLAQQYGDKLTIAGLSKLVNSVFEQFLDPLKLHTIRYLTGRSRRFLSPVDEDGMRRSVRLNTTIAMQPKDYNAFMRLIRSAYEWDWYPSLSNVWDAVPLSFVVEWFVNVGDILRSIDRLVASRYYDVAATLDTVKVTASSPLAPDVNVTYYRRTVGRQLHLSVDSVSAGLPVPVNCINGVALLLGSN